jgi:hypothetical protein
MRDNRHYDCLVTRPAKESMCGFLLMGVAINDVEPTVPPWLSPVKITQDMEPVVRAYHARHNPVRVALEDGLRKSAIESLRRAVPEANLNGPLNPEAERLVQELVEGCRSALLCRDESVTDDILRRNAPFDGERFNRELCARVIVAAGHALGSPGHEATAKYLNDGLPPGEKGLTRDHVGRASKSHDKMLERLIRAAWRSPLVTPDLLARLMFADIELVRHLDTVYRHARVRPEFKTLRGVDLALAIHAQFDLNERIHRAAGLPRAKLTAA